MRHLFRALRAPVVAALLAACADSGGEGGGTFRTVMETVGDTIVARTTGEVLDAGAVRPVLEWRASDGAGGETEGIGEVSGMAVGPDGRVFVWDHVTPAIWLFDAHGALLRKVGRPGGGPGEYDRVNGLAVRPDGHLFAWDAGNARLNLYDADGAAVTSWRLPFGGWFTSNALTADDRGWVWIRSSLRGTDDTRPQQQIGLRFDTTGTLMDTVLAPMYETGDPFLVARNEPSPGSRNVSMSGIPYGTYPAFAISPRGFIVSGPGRPYTIHAQHDGRPLRIEREFTPVPVPDAERSQLRARSEHNLRRTQPDWRWDGRDVPADKPPYAALSVGRDGRIWVQLHGPSEEFEPDPPSPTLVNPPPTVRFRAADRRWDVFEPDGRYLGRVIASRQFTMFAAQGDYVWGVLRDEDDVPAVVKMRVVFPR